jgi:hypothetical protein
MMFGASGLPVAELDPVRVNRVLVQIRQNLVAQTAVMTGGPHLEV